ncbi:DoxX family protein [Azomonas macrocytogenes]|uniref:Putative oxidoreductase n=1 Tax=Azomonas macrocytogenes TaxID=69962 RepID=A0A839T1H4_AZOMA|nr:DoxX family protein [Azomonas macrocytogenes]MBB3102958.1 putative oxidoreductase [Azomonas macrocytogenes]
MPFTINDTTTFTGRALLSSLFLVSGFAKVTAPDATLGYIGSTGMPFPTLALIAALVIELGFASALLVGYRTRFVAAVMAGFSLATALVFHNQLGDQNQLIHFLKNLAIAGGLLQLAIHGGGALSLDIYRSRRVALA